MNYPAVSSMKAQRKCGLKCTQNLLLVTWVTELKKIEKKSNHL